MKAGVVRAKKMKEADDAAQTTRSLRAARVGPRRTVEMSIMFGGCHISADDADISKALFEHTVEQAVTAGPVVTLIHVRPPQLITNKSLKLRTAHIRACY